MTFLITLLVLIMERFFHWQHLRRWQWFWRYESWLTLKISTWPASFRLMIHMLPPIVLIGAIDFLLTGFLYGILSFIFRAVVLLYCLGPENLWNHWYRRLTEQTQATLARGAPIPDAAIETNSTAQAIFIDAHDKIFAVIFWFVVLGPIGAVLYRLTDLLSTHAELNVTPLALRLKQVLDWVPIRIFTFLFALAGQFLQVFKIWQKSLLLGLNYNESFLTECGVAALEQQKNHESPLVEKEALALLDRVLILGLVILAIGVLLI